MQTTQQHTAEQRQRALEMLFEAADAIGHAAHDKAIFAAEARCRARAEAAHLMGLISDEELDLWNRRLGVDEDGSARMRLEELRPRSSTGYEIRAVYEERPESATSADAVLSVYSIPLQNNGRGFGYHHEGRFVCWGVYRFGAGPLEWISDHNRLVDAQAALAELQAGETR